jgi:hypothetical protein
VASVVLYSVPRIPLYLATICRRKSYSRLKLYFRTRITTFLMLLVIHVALFFSILQQSGDLASIYEVTSSWVMLCTAAPMLMWLSIDLYWSAAIRTYKDSKKGKQGQQAAERLHRQIDPNSFLYDNETKFNPTMQD